MQVKGIKMKFLDKAKIHIRPTKDCADIILSGEADREAYRIFVKKIINLVKEIHFDKVLMYN